MINPKDVGRVVVLMGGNSSEREISLRSGKAIYSALLDEGYNAAALDIDDHNENALIERLNELQASIVFIALHGAFGENGELQKILEEHEICYTGSDAPSSQLAFSKARTQKMLLNNGIRVPDFKVLTKNDKNVDNIRENIGYPVFIKPSEEGSSYGITFVQSEKDFRKACQLAWEYSADILIEQAVSGREITVGIVEDRALPIVEIVPKSSYFDYKAKYEKGETKYFVPADIDRQLTGEIQDTALKAFSLLGCRHFARVDFILKEKQVYLLELNTIPGFTETSLLPKAAQADGLNFNQLCNKLIGLSYGEKKKTSITHSY